MTNRNKKKMMIIPVLENVIIESGRGIYWIVLLRLDTFCRKYLIRSIFQRNVVQ